MSLSKRKPHVRTVFNTPIPIIKEIYVSEMLNINTLENNFTVIVKYGRKKKDANRVPLAFKKAKPAEDMVDEMQQFVGKPLDEFLVNPALAAILLKYKALAINQKAKPANHAQ